jgi:hypothetical protein
MDADAVVGGRDKQGPGFECQPSILTHRGPALVRNGYSVAVRELPPADRPRSGYLEYLY